MQKYDGKGYLALSNLLPLLNEVVLNGWKLVEFAAIVAPINNLVLLS